MGDAAEFMSQAATTVAAGAAPPAAAVLLVGTIGVFWFPGGWSLEPLEGPDDKERA